MLLSGADALHVRQAAERLAEGGLVGMPTETVYGLGARADEDAAVGRIFAAKGRPANHPLIVHVLDEADAARFAEGLSDSAKRLIHAFWPGPLTVIARRLPGVGAAAAGGQTTIGLRCPAHPVARALLEAARELGVFGIAAPSANRFGRVSPTTAAHVVEEFGTDLLVLDGGECEVGIESSIVDCSGDRPVLLRPGVLLRSAIEEAAGEPLGKPSEASPRASGTLAAHYAPNAVVRLVSADALSSVSLPGSGEGESWGGSSSAPALAIYARSDPKPGPGVSLDRAIIRKMPNDARAVAHELFSVLRMLDEQGVREIWIERPPDSPAWEGVLDRLMRAAAAAEMSAE